LLFEEEYFEEGEELCNWSVTSNKKVIHSSLQFNSVFLLRLIIFSSFRFHAIFLIQHKN